MRSISEDLFNKDIVDEYLCLLKNGKPCNPPSIVIEVVFSGEEDTVALYKGDFNSRGVAESGIKLDIAIDAESFSDEYQDFVAAKSHHGLPIEYIKGWSVHGTAGSCRGPTAWRTCRSASST